MATHATTINVSITSALATFPAPAGPAQRHQRLNIANIGAATAWIRVDGTTTAATVAGDECVPIDPGQSIELEYRTSAHVIGAGATQLSVWGRP